MPSYRIASQHDAPALARIRWDFRLEETNGQSNSTWEEFGPVCERFIADGIASGQWTYWVAVDDVNRQLIGCICIFTIRKIPKPNQFEEAFGYMTNVYMRPEHRNQGIGSGLMDAVIEWARNVPLTNLLVYPSELSQDYYARKGFVPDVEARTLDFYPSVV